MKPSGSTGPRWRPRARLLPVLALTLAAVAFGAPKKRAPPKPPPPPPPVTVFLATAVDGTDTPGARDAAMAALRAALAKWRVTVSSPPDGGVAVKKAVGLELSVSLKAGKGRGLDASMLVSTYPSAALKGEYRAGGAGADLLDLVSPVVEKLVADVAKDEGWAPAP